MLLKYVREQTANITGGKERLLATVEEGKVMALCYMCVCPHEYCRLYVLRRVVFDFGYCSKGEGKTYTGFTFSSMKWKKNYQEQIRF